MSTRGIQAILLVAVLAAAMAATAQQVVPKGNNLAEVTVTVAGTDEADALRMALRQAVETGAGTYIYSQSQTKDFALVKDTVLARAAGFVQSHTVVSKRALPDGTIELKVVAIVSVQGIVDTWGAVTTLLGEMGRPKIMVFVSEKIDTVPQDDSVVQTRIENMLLKSGFLLVNKEQIAAIDRKDLAAAAAEDSPARLQAIAKRFGAQLFISGVANSNAGPTGNVGGVALFPYQADANIRCYRSDTAQLLSSIPGEPTRGVDRVARSGAQKSLDAQAQQVAPRVVADILTFWQDALSGRGEVQLMVDNITFTQYTDLKRRLGTLPQIKQVNGRFANQTAELSIQADSTAEVLAEKIAQALGDLEITDVSANVIKAKMKGAN
jgi:hypothetical protein